jgi:hypothetical protein
MTAQVLNFTYTGRTPIAFTATPKLKTLAIILDQG